MPAEGGDVPVDEHGRFVPPGAGEDSGDYGSSEAAAPSERRGRGRRLATIVAAGAVAVGVGVGGTIMATSSPSTSGPAREAPTTLTLGASPSRSDPAIEAPPTDEPADQDGEERAAQPDSPEAIPAGLDTVVDRIVDGDTLYVAALEERVRLIGIDTPETKHPNRDVECFGHEAAAHLMSLVPPGTEVRVVFDVEREDRYGRPLGYLYRVQDGAFINLRMVADGYAQVATYPPNVTHADEFVAAQASARDASRGLWEAC